MNPVKTRTRKDSETGARQRVWVIDFFYVDKTGVRRRYRRDARVQIKSAAEGEAKRLLVAATTTGVVPGMDDMHVETQHRRSIYTFSNAVSDWKKNWVKKHSSCKGYEINFEAHLLPRFADRPLDGIGFADVSELRASLKDRAMATVNNVEVALRSVLRLAVAHDRLPAMPRLPALRKVPKKIIVPPTVEDVEVVLATAYPAAKLALALAAYAGLRSGEIRALRFRDVNMKSWTIRVRSAISRGVEGPPKSGHEREIPMPASLVRIFGEVLKVGRKPDDFVALSSRGTPWAEGSLLHAFQSVLKKVNLPRKRVHDLRHFFVTECFRAGIAAPDVQQLAGHLNLEVTQGYAHTTKDSQRVAIKRFEQHLASARDCLGKEVETEGGGPVLGTGEGSEKTDDSRLEAA